IRFRRRLASSITTARLPAWVCMRSVMKRTWGHRFFLSRLAPHADFALAEPYEVHPPVILLASRDVLGLSGPSPVGLPWRRPHYGWNFHAFARWRPYQSDIAARP